MEKLYIRITVQNAPALGSISSTSPTILVNITFYCNCTQILTDQIQINIFCIVNWYKLIRFSLIPFDRLQFSWLKSRNRRKNPKFKLR